MTKASNTDEKNTAMRRSLEDLTVKSEEFLRRIENALRQPYEYADARQDYEAVLKALTVVETSVEKRGAGPVDDKLARRPHDEFLAAAKREKEEVDSQFGGMAAAAAAARRRLAE